MTEKDKQPLTQLGDQAWRSNKADSHFFEPTYSGALSFLRRPYSRDFQTADVAILGVPYDGAVTYRPGCRLGPRAIRAASVQLAELDAFPFGENDDFCDSTTMALMRIRQGGLVELDSDYQEDMQVDRTALSYY